MLKIIVFLSLVATCSALYPGRLYREEWGNQMMAIPLINLTVIMCKDCLLKLRMADRIQETYKNSLAYELGLLASGIMDKFKHMLEIYRFYSSAKALEKRSYTIDEVMNGYHIMQGDYNEIRAEAELFNQIVNRQTHKKKEEDDLLEEYVKRHPGLDLQRLKEARDQGMTLPPGFNINNRRAMTKKNDTNKVKNTSETTNFTHIEDLVLDAEKLMSRRNRTEWNKRKDPKEAEYKKKLRYIMWADRWKGFDPEIEGVNIPNKLAKVGFANASEFLVKEFKDVL